MMQNRSKHQFSKKMLAKLKLTVLYSGGYNKKTPVNVYVGALTHYKQKISENKYINRGGQTNICGRYTNLVGIK